MKLNGFQKFSKLDVQDEGSLIDNMVLMDEFITAIGELAL